MDWKLVAQNLSVKGTNNIFVDLGAQVGTYSEFFWVNYNTVMNKLISVEPHHENTQKIRERIARCNAQEKWVVDECAISISDGEQDFSYLRTDNGEPLGSFYLEENFKRKEYPIQEEKLYQDKMKELEHIKVKLKTMRNICENPNIIKIDIEGYEYPILPEILRIPSVYALIIEFGQTPYPARKSNGYLLEDYLTWLHHKGFTDMMGQTDEKDGFCYFIPSFPKSLRWEDLPPYPYNRCFHVLAQKQDDLRMIQMRA